MNEDLNFILHWAEEESNALFEDDNPPSRFRLQMLENPGWLLESNLKDLSLSKSFVPIKKNIDVKGFPFTNDWIDCWAKETTFAGACSFQNIGHLLFCFRSLIDPHCFQDFSSEKQHTFLISELGTWYEQEYLENQHNNNFMNEIGSIEISFSAKADKWLIQLGIAGTKYPITRLQNILSNQSQPKDQLICYLKERSFYGEASKGYCPQVLDLFLQPLRKR